LLCGPASLSPDPAIRNTHRIEYAMTIVLDARIQRAQTAITEANIVAVGAAIDKAIAAFRATSAITTKLLCRPAVVL